MIFFINFKCFLNKPASFRDIGGVTRVYLVYWNNKNKVAATFLWLPRSGVEMERNLWEGSEKKVWYTASQIKWVFCVNWVWVWVRVLGIQPTPTPRPKYSKNPIPIPILKYSKKPNFWNNFFEYLGMGFGYGYGFFWVFGYGFWVFWSGCGLDTQNPHPDPNGWVFWVQLTVHRTVMQK